MAWFDWLSGSGGPQRGPQPVATPQTPDPQPVAYRRQQAGLLGWLRDSLGGWLGPVESRRTPVEQEVNAERIRSGPSGVVLPWFAPYLDEHTGETAGMRLAYRRMLADPNVKAAICGKILAVAALDLNVIPHEPRQTGRSARTRRGQATDRDREVADFVRWNLTERVQGCLPELAWGILSGGLIDGYSVSEKVWHHEDRGDYAGNYILHALKPKDVGQDVVIETDDYRNVVGVRALRYSGGEIYSPAHFVIYRHLPLFGMPVGMSDLRAAYSRWWMLDTVLKLRAMGLEKRALPLLRGEYETTAQKPSLEAALALARSQSWISVPRGVQIEAINIAGGADAMFAAAVADLKEDIFLAIQGATLQALTGQEGTQRGSSKVHQTTSDLFKWHLARSLEVLLNDRDSGLVRDLVDLNYVVGGYPRCVLGAIDAADLLLEAQLDQSLISMGLTLSKSELYEKYSRTPPDSPEDSLSLQPPAPSPGAPPGGSGSEPGEPGDPGAGPVPQAGGASGGTPEDDAGGPVAGEFADATWDEGKHPRDHGKFAKKGSVTTPGEGRAASRKDSPTDTPGKGVPSEVPPPQQGATANEDTKADPEAVPAVDWTGVVGSGGDPNLRRMAADPHRLNKERVALFNKLLGVAHAAITTVDNWGKALGGVLYRNGGPEFRQFVNDLHSMGAGLKKAVLVAYSGWHYLEKHFFDKIKTGMQALAATIAEERGLSEAHVERVAHITTLIDNVMAWSGATIYAAHEYLHAQFHMTGMAAFLAAKIGYFLPTASLAYCAYAGTRNPLAMVRAAWRVLRGRGYKRPDDAHASHAEGDEPLTGRRLIEAVLDRLDQAGKASEWWFALFSVAFDRTHDTRAALEMADSALADHDGPPDDGAGFTPEELEAFFAGDKASETGGRFADATTTGTQSPGGPDSSVSLFTRRASPMRLAEAGSAEPSADGENRPGEPRLIYLPPKEFLPWIEKGYTPWQDDDGNWRIGDDPDGIDGDDADDFAEDDPEHAEDAPGEEPQPPAPPRPENVGENRPAVRQNSVVSSQQRSPAEQPTVQPTEQQGAGAGRVDVTPQPPEDPPEAPPEDPAEDPAEADQTRPVVPGVPVTTPGTETPETPAPADPNGADRAWYPTPGSVGGRVWKNSVTGEVRYGDRQPGGTVADYHRKVAKQKEEVKRVLALPVQRPTADNTPPAATEALTRLVGNDDPGIAATLVGALGGSRVRISGGKFPFGGDVVRIYIDHPFIDNCQREIRQDEDGTLTCTNQFFFLKKRFRGGGFGLDQFTSQVQGLAESGFSRINTCAGRGNGMNGYYTWARMGYDAELRRSFLKKLPEGLREARTVQDLMATPEGRAYWKQRGYMTDMSFDLDAGSRSRQVLDAYLKEKGKDGLAIDDEKASSSRERILADHARRTTEQKEEGERGGQTEMARLRKEGLAMVLREAKELGVDRQSAIDRYDTMITDNMGRLQASGQRDGAAITRAVQGASLSAAHSVAYERYATQFASPKVAMIHKEYARKAAALGMNPESIRRLAELTPVLGGSPQENVQASYEQAIKHTRGRELYQAAQTRGGRR